MPRCELRDDALQRADGDAARPRPGPVVATICSLAPRTATDFAAFFETHVRPALAEAGARVLATFVTEQSPNTFPRLPVREGETVFVWFSGFADEAAYARFFHAMLAEGVAMAPGAYEALFVGVAHTDDVLDRIAEAAAAAARVACAT